MNPVAGRGRAERADIEGSGRLLAAVGNEQREPKGVMGGEAGDGDV